MAIGDSRLDKVTGTIQLMVVALLEYRFGGQLLMCGIEVAVGALCLFHTFDKLLAECDIFGH